MNVAAIREDLVRTGVLFTQNEGDVGHISNFWRSTILGLCDAFDAAPTDVADLLKQEREVHSATRSELDRVRSDLDAMHQDIVRADQEKIVAESARSAALQLVAEAVPRMQTLNNAMSPGWLARAATLLGE